MVPKRRMAGKKSQKGKKGVWSRPDEERGDLKAGRV